MNTPLDPPAPDYGSRARFGLLVPQANPTVEPEFRRLMPRDVEIYVARLASRAPDARERLVDYLERVTDTLAQYDTLRLRAIAFACTGSSYLLGHDRERALLAAASRAAGAPVESAAIAIADALRFLGARRLCIVAPYPAWLRAAGEHYWRDAGFDVLQSVDVPTGRADTRGIYELHSTDAARALEALEPGKADAILLSGTGLPTLPLLAARRDGRRPAAASSAHLPLLTSNACLAWRLRSHLGAAVAGSPAALPSD